MNSNSKMKFKSLFILFSIPIVALAIYYTAEYNKKEYTYAEIWSYRISLMTNAQIREVAKLAAIKAEENRAKVIENKSAREMDSLDERCIDIAFRERNPGICHRSAGIRDPAPRRRGLTKDSVYEQLIMGVCIYIDKKDHTALRKGNCIP